MQRKLGAWPVEPSPMHWELIQDSDRQWRAVCRQLGLALLMLHGEGTPLFYWRLRGKMFEVERERWGN